MQMVHVGNHVKDAFPSSKHRSNEILDLVHSNVFGPMSVASITGACNMFPLLMIYLVRLGTTS
jgi:hypothetical protein